MKSDISMKIDGLVTCAAGAKDYFFLGIYDPSSINIYELETYQLVKTVNVRRPPVSMTILNKKYVLCGLKNHAFTTLNIHNNFKQKGMTW